MKEQRYIISGSYDYADEFNYPVLSIITEEQRDLLLKCEKLILNMDTEFYFGTNESLSFKPNEIIDMINDAEPISEEEYIFFNKHQFIEQGSLDIIEGLISSMDDEDNVQEYPELREVYDRLLEI
jgi:hypothetical protein